MRLACVALSVVLLMALVGCGSVELPDAQYYAVGYTRAMLDQSAEGMASFGVVDPDTQTSVQTKLASRVGDDIKDVLVEDESTQGDTTVVRILLTARDGRRAVVAVDVSIGTDKVTDIELQ